MFSNDNGYKSTHKSNYITNTIKEITNNNLSEDEEDNISFVVRKIAHFALYFVLGILVYVTLMEYGIDKNIIVYSILITFIYAISDEIHQLFIDGRSFKIYDIIIDTLASTISILLSNLFYKKKKI